MTLFKWSLLISYLLVSGYAFLFLFRLRRLISYHFGMNMAMVAGGVNGLAIGLVLGALFPMHFTLVTVLTTLLAVAGGVIFGALVDYQTLITGAVSGIMSGLMGPMIVMMADQPLILLAFGSLLVYASFGVLCFSVRA